MALGSLAALGLSLVAAVIYPLALAISRHMGRCGRPAWSYGPQGTEHQGSHDSEMKLTRPDGQRTAALTPFSVFYGR